MKSMGIVGNWFFIPANLLSTFYSFGWDIYMDWGLLRGVEGKRFLRAKTSYPNYFYYMAMPLDLVLRLTWILNLFTYDENKDWFWNWEVLTMIEAVSEGFRRGVWAIFRVENENVNNFEKYRTILQIPAVKEEELIE